MQYQQASEAMAGYRRQMSELREKMRAIRRTIEPMPVRDYELATESGPLRLSQLFGDKDDLIVIHNMGASCRYCTLWADGFNGILPHLEDRAAFVITSPDEPKAQQKFKASRGWNLRLVSHRGSTFAQDMGYRSEERWLPGISVFKKRDGAIVRVADQGMGPGDDFCSLWHFFDLLPEGAGDWEPKFNYRAASGQKTKSTG